MSTLPRYLSWPGKSRIEPYGPAHPAVYHMLDVAAVAEVLIEPLGFKEPLRSAVLLLTAVHDLGKIGNQFRSMLELGIPQTHGPHWVVSEVLLRHLDGLLGARLGSEQEIRFDLYASTAGHHGSPPQSLNRKQIRREAGAEALEDSGKVVEAFLALWPRASLATIGSEEAVTLSWWLPGFVTAADWIGSNTDWFPPSKPELSPAEYLDEARVKARHALSEAGLVLAVPAKRNLFAFEPRPMQKACLDVPLPEGAMLAIIEDETGAGKTEAALMLAQRMMLGGKGKGLFFGLPTMATANSMFERAKDSVGRMFEAAPSLTLAHGRAASSGAFRELSARQTPGTDAPVCSTWLMDSRRRALLAQVGVGTIDQALLSVLNTRFSTLRHFGLSSKILIVDEVHELGDPYLARSLQQLLRAHRMSGGSAILMTATLPLEERASLMSAFNGEVSNDPAYPALTLSDGSGRRGLSRSKDFKGPVAVERFATDEEVLSKLALAAATGAACVWVRNAVDDAIAAVGQLKALGVEADLLHARFALSDRLAHERAAIGRFGKNGVGRAGRVLVATQVVEASLDLDFDVMVSDLAPIAALIQRAGRLWRHMDRRPAERRPVPRPVLSVLSPDPGRVDDPRWLHSVLESGAWVYPMDLQWRTAQTLFAAGRIEAPGGLRALIEAVHGADEIDLPEALEEAERWRLGEGYAAWNQADQNLIDLTQAYRYSARNDDDADYPTRLGRPQKRLVLTRWEGDELVPWAGADAGQLSEVQAAETRFRGIDLPDQNTPQIKGFTADWPEWRRRALHVCPVAEDGSICNGLSYSRSLGLLFT